MNTDFYFEAGTSHHVCQDYALSGVYRDLYYAIGSDGCSSSKDTDVGARILCHIAKEAVINLREKMWVDSITGGEFSWDASEMFLRNQILYECEKTGHRLRLDQMSFDATLWIIVAYWGKFLVMGWGDGVVIEQYKDKIITIHKEYKSNAPFYLSYYFNQERAREYHKQFGETPVNIQGRCFVNGVWGDQEGYSELYTKPFVKVVPSGVSTISVCSDGITSYLKTDGGKTSPISLYDVAPSWVDYKNMSGEFVKRRMMRVKKDNGKNSIHHYDDIFCASINIG